jgi:hypothetical protein
MTIKEIITAHLRKVGATGLCREECGCRLKDLMPCDIFDASNCVPAVERGCGIFCEECFGDGCMVPLVEADSERKGE